MHNVLLIHADGQKLAAALASDDVTVHLAANADEALELLARQRKIDLIMTPARLGGDVDGFEFLLKAKDIAPQAAALVIEAKGILAGQPAHPQLGILHFAPLPSRPESIAILARGILTSAKPAGLLLENMELTDIVQLACLAGRTAILHLRYEDRKGRIAFKDGNIVHAEFGEGTGKEALFDLLALRQGNMFLQNGGTTDAHTVTTPWHGLVREASHGLAERRARLDREEEERKRNLAISEADVADLLQVSDLDGAALSGEIKGGGSLFDDEDLAEIGDLDGTPALPSRLPPPASQSQRPAAAPRSYTPSAIPARQPSSTRRAARPVPRSLPVTPVATEQTLPRLLERFCDEIPELIATDIVHSADGLSIIGASTVPEYDSHAAGAFYSDFLNSCRRAIEDFSARDELEEVLVTTQNAYILIRLLQGTPYMHLVMMHRTGNLGIGKVTMRRYEPHFAQLLPA